MLLPYERKISLVRAADNGGERRCATSMAASLPASPWTEEKLSFKIPCPDRPPREKILKLGSMNHQPALGLKATADDPEYWGLDAAGDR